MDALTVQNDRGSLTYVDPAAVAAAETAKALIQSAYIMAFRKPRNEMQARDRIMEACRRPAFAERVEYAKPVGNKTIKGPSIRFAELAVREWGNVRTDSQVVYEDEAMRRIRVTCIDLENNSTFSKEIQITKTVERSSDKDREVVSSRTNTYGKVVYIVRATDDELQNKEAALISKAIRNEGLRLIPSDIVDDAIEEAKTTLRNRDKGDPKAALKKVLDSLSSIGIKPKELEKYLKHSLETISPPELETLRGVYRAIRDGEATWADYLKSDSATEGPHEDPAALIAAFDKMAQEKRAAEDSLYEFLEITAHAQDLTVDDIKVAAAGAPQKFWKAFDKWQGQRKIETPPPANGQGPVKGITEEQKTRLEDLIAEKGIPNIEVCKSAGVSAISEMDYMTAQRAIIKLEVV